jgi:hypothetical protein
MTLQSEDLLGVEISVAMTEAMHEALMSHLLHDPHQEDLTFAYWRVSRGSKRLTAIVSELALPGGVERQLHGNASFTGAYLRRVLRERPEKSGIAFMHSHLGPGWQGMSHDDVVAERDRISSAACGQSRLPLLGLTLGTDGTWSARLWSRSNPNHYERTWARDVRVIGGTINISRNEAEDLSRPVREVSGQ